MSLSLYSVTVPVYLQVLPSIAGLVDKAEAWCRENEQDDSALTMGSLTADMWPFSKQVLMCLAHSIGAVDGVKKGETGPDGSEPPVDFASLKAQVADAIARLKALTPAEVDALQGKDVKFVFSTRTMEFVAEDYFTSFALPNFFFHATTAYAILRERGLNVGKKDFLGAVKLKA